MSNNKKLGLSDLLNFTCEDVIESFAEKYSTPIIESREIFLDLMKFLWLSNEYKKTHQDCQISAIEKEILIIDEMWHTFILFTKEYHEFCDKYFGHYIHHAPTTEREKKIFSEKTKDESFIKEHIEKTRKKYSAVYDILGRETFIRWYHQFPQKYSVEKIRESKCV